MRSLLRRRINEVSADNWADADLDDILNFGLHKVQQRIMAVDPEAFIYKARTPVVANEEFIDKPVGMWYEKSVRLLNTASNLYETIEPMDYDLAVLHEDDSERVYSHLGRFFALHPIPTTSVAAGFEILYIPTLDMAADSDVPDVKVPLHECIVKAAQLVLMPETGEPYKDLKESLENDLNEIPLYYRVSAGRAPLLRPDVDKGY